MLFLVKEVESVGSAVYRRLRTPPPMKQLFVPAIMVLQGQAQRDWGLGVKSAKCTWLLCCESQGVLRQNKSPVA